VVSLKGGRDAFNDTTEYEKEEKRMAAWLVTALNLLATLSGIGTRRGGIEIPGGLAQIDQFQLTTPNQPGFFPGGLGVELKPKRRRRRRALTASDRGDIAFIAGLLGKPAGKDFAVIIGAKNA